MTKIKLRDGEFDLQVGDTVFVVGTNCRPNTEQKIVKIGRDYFYTDRDLKFKIESGREYQDKGACGAPRYCCSSKTVYEEILNLKEKSLDIRSFANDLVHADSLKNKKLIEQLHALTLKDIK